MSYTVIPIQATPITRFSVPLDTGNAQVTLTTTEEGLFADVIYNGVPVALGRRCMDRTNLNPAPYLGLPQGLYFADQRGTTDPVWTGFNTRYLLCYGDPDTNGGSSVA